jgi:hypothetical protein
MKRLPPIVLVLAALTAGACNNSANSTTAPTTAPPSHTDTLTGTVPVGGSFFNNFVVGQSGEIDITVVAAGPPATIFVGVGVGQPTTTTCPHTFGEVKGVQAGPNPLTPFLLNPGTYCLDIFDIGNQSGPITYTVTVAHP